MNNEAVDLIKNAVHKKLFVMIRSPKDLDRLEASLTDHLRWMITAEGRGQIFASGPFTGAGKRPGELGGMTIIRASSLAEAESIALQDPFIENGAFSYDIREWTLVEGRVSITVNFSNSAIRVH